MGSPAPTCFFAPRDRSGDRRDNVAIASCKSTRPVRTSRRREGPSAVTRSVSIHRRSITVRSFSRLLVVLLSFAAVLHVPTHTVVAAAPLITNASATGILVDSATVTWTTDVAADSQIEIGTTVSYGTSTPLAPNLVTAHSQSLGALQPNTLYHFRVKSRDGAGNLATSADKVFVTAMGYSAVGPLLDFGDNNVMNGNRFVSTAGGKVVSLSAHVGVTGVAPNNKFQMAIYSEVNNAPGALIANTAVGNLVANSWNTLPLTTTPTLAPNTPYYITFNSNGSDNNLNNLHYMNSASQSVKWRFQTFGTYPSTFGALTSQETMTQSVYASFVPVDSTPPVVAVTAPTGGAVSGTVTVTATATDDTGVTSVQFKRGSTNLGVLDTAPPYSVTWDTTLAISANETLTAVATDAAGNVTVSAPVNVTTDNPANVRITQPTSGQVIAATDVTVTYDRGGNIVAGDGQHAHLRFDGGPTKMDLDFDGSYVFTGVTGASTRSRSSSPTSTTSSRPAPVRRSASAPRHRTSPHRPSASRRRRTEPPLRTRSLSRRAPAMPGAELPGSSSGLTAAECWPKPPRAILITPTRSTRPRSRTAATT